ncbi:FAD/NAD(P)-binding protein [Psychroserpens luteus]|uniref:FAD/NAD(P)-binding protein n=1 Tax=Psychroserpens luteus TaxID=1434066 RepID=A0ABW5ZRC2_9FLAO|nr:FAD/NAD(P)-binding domain-containing protein [Psychroserpens luteus]
MKTLAIIGAGPRGLFALENLLYNLSASKKELQILVFDPSKFPGAGPVWYLEQADSNWTNITERALIGLKGRTEIDYLDLKIPAFPSYHEWANYKQEDTEPDTFPPRHKIGQYLNERFESLHTILKSSPNFKFVESKVVSLEFTNDKLIVKTQNESYICNETLLTIGHQPTKQSQQLKSWHEHANTNNGLLVFDEPYPVSKFDNLKNQTNRTIGLRGFGLAMIDVMRALVINNFGNFKIIDPSTFESIYYKSKTQNLKLIPFSLDGLPLIPKPLNPEIDAWFQPTEDEISFFKSEIETYAQGNKQADSIDFLIKPIAKIISRIYEDLGSKAMPHNLDSHQLEAIVLAWLKNQDYKNTLIQDKTIAVYDLIKSYINMALGEQSISLDFCIGQVWRHCQPTLYTSFSHSNLDDELIEEVIALDESTKCYSYGPPIESMQQVLALVDADVLSLDFTNDPDIEFINEGWKLKNNKGENITTSVMINSVLDSPKLLEVSSSIIENLIADDLIQPIHTKLGIETKKNGIVISSEIEKQIPIAVLGRLAKGSVIGVDAILECFGNRIKDWAKSFVERLD